MTERKLATPHRVRLIFFAIRHAAGVALLVWFTVLAYQTLPRSQAYLLTAITAGFALFAAITWLRLLRLYRRRALSS